MKATCQHSEAIFKDSSFARLVWKNRGSYRRLPKEER